MREYGKERDAIAKKYDTVPAQYYRRRLCAKAMKTSFAEMPPAKSAQEIASKALDKTGAFFAGANQKYQISQKTSVAAEATKAKMSDAAAATKAGASAAAASTKAGFMSLWGRAKTLVAKNGSAAAEEEQKEEA